MAVDARQLENTPTQMIQPKREIINSYQDNANRYNTNINSSVAIGHEMMPPFQQLAAQDPVSATTLMNSISGITYNNVHATGKRQRDSYAELNASNAFLLGSKFSSMPQYFLDADITQHIQTQLSDIDQLIAQHAERIRLELGERRKKQSRMLVSYIYHEVAKKLKEKDEEIEKMKRLNWVLEEKVKSMSMENQLWRDLAKTNEATANSLRTNLEQALAQVAQEHHNNNNNNCAREVAEDVESCCDNTDYTSEANKRSRFMMGAGTSSNINNGLCRRCGVEESRVLLLPCRHLCLCALCAPSVKTCPVCNSII